MTTQWQTFPIQFNGGLISSLSPLQHGIQAVGSAAIMQNFEPSLDGGYAKILGYEKLIDTKPTVSTTDVMQALCVVDDDTVIVARGGDYYKGTVSSDTWSSSLATAVDTSFTTVNHQRYNFTGTEKIIFTDGTNFPAIYDVSAGTMTYITTSVSNDAVENASDVALYKSTLFFAVGTELVFTAPYTDTDFTVANGAGSVNVVSPITGLAVYRDQLIIFCVDRILRIVGSSAADFQLITVTEEIGCLEGTTIQEVGGDIVFLAPDGIRTFSSTERIGDFGLDVASKSIRPTVDNLRTTNTHFCSAVIVDKAQYRLFGYNTATQTAASNGILGTKFIDQGGTGFQWATLKGFKAYVTDSFFDGDSEVYVFANEDGYVYKMESGNSRDGSDISAVLETPYMPINDPKVRKTFYKLDLYVEPLGSFNLDVNILLDQNKAGSIQPSQFNFTNAGGDLFFYDDPSSTYGTAKYSVIIDETYANNLVGSGKTVAIRFEDIGTNASFTLDTVVLEFATNDRQ